MSNDGAGSVPVIRREPATSAAARRCVDSYMRELGEIFPDGFAPTGSDQVDFEGLAPPEGDFLVIDVDGDALGCGALRRLSPEEAPGAPTGEIKRMWLSSSLRGQGLAAQLLKALEASATEMGLERIRLDTSKYLEAAIALYLRNGYVEVEAYNTNPYAHHWFEKDLSRQADPDQVS